MIRHDRRRARGSGRWISKAGRSNALDLDRGVFAWSSPRRIAASLKRSAIASRRRKATAFRSAMSMLNFYINRAGRSLAPRRRAILDRAKDELRVQFGRAPLGRRAHA